METSDKNQIERQSHMHLSVLTVSRLQNQSFTCLRGRESKRCLEQCSRQDWSIGFGERVKRGHRSESGENVFDHLNSIEAVTAHLPIYLPPTSSPVPSSPSTSTSSTSSLVPFDHRSPYAFTVTKQSKLGHSNYNMEQSCCVVVSFLFISLISLALVLIYLSQSTKVMKEGMSGY